MSLEYRAAATAAPKDESREFDALAVPFDSETRLYPWLYERFAPGSVTVADSAPILYCHDEPIGRITSWESREDGLWITGKLSTTQRAAETLTLLKDEVLSKCSIGFEAGKYTEEYDEDDNLHITHMSDVIVREVSLVPVPAYPDTTVTNIRSKAKEPNERNAPMDDPKIQKELETQRSALDKLALQMEQLAANSASGQEEKHPLSQFRSFGAYVRAVAAGEERATEALRDFEGTTSEISIARPIWVERLQADMEKKQKLTNLFTHSADLPATGMTFEYVQEHEDELAVAKQTKEGDTLPHGKLVKDTIKSVSVETYGGYTTMSKQAIQRASESLVSDNFERMARRYALAIEKATKALVASTYTTAVTNPMATIDNLAQATPVTWVDTMLTAVESFDDTPYNLDALLVSREVFMSLFALKEHKSALQITESPTDKLGTLTISVPKAELAGVPVIWTPSLTGKKAAAVSRSAIRVKESAGAPWRLQDENVADLTGVFSVYGYAAHYVPVPAAFKAIKITQ
ncbi:HK97 family phage prohead protease [Boudabousia marimammalium]|uniref:Prohead serine protease domain-containing protein n=1 Tax=Boudabousia marimammalium TaxID=156892 RepID=A0A1Q5PP59_9ACTO|nr:HK97 family phage prohead protease [Boudabousia marimammalium]OKL49299.1 hypothetical protein BM477_04775 [Boudabousia marimammalium]